MKLHAKLRLAVLRVRRCAGGRRRYARVGHIWWKRPSQVSAVFGTWPLREGRAIALSCTTYPSVRPTRRSTGSATVFCSAATMYQKLTFGGGSFDLTPIFRLRLRGRTSQCCMTIPTLIGRTRWLRSLGKGRGGRREQFRSGWQQFSLLQFHRTQHDR